MIGMLAGLVGRMSGPILVYVLLALVASNAATGYLLKRALTQNAQAVLACENAALRDAAAARTLVDTEMQRIQNDLAASEQFRKDQGRIADKRNAAALRTQEIAHAAALADMEIATNEIADDEFFCASEPVATDQLVRMRRDAASYNQNRNLASARTVPD